MPEADILTEHLRALADLGVDELNLDEIRARTARDLSDAIVTRRAPRPSWRSRGVLVSATCVLVAIMVVAGTLVFASGGRRDQPAAPPGASRLIARLAVLRRPQTAADRLPPSLRVIRGLTGTIQPRLTRLVAQRPGLRLYLVVSTPARPPGGLDWPAGLGDQVSIVSVRGHSGEQSAPVPAADLDNATQFVRVPHAIALGLVQIVPDGVASVRWTYPHGRHPRGAGHTSAVKNNLALAPPLTGTIPRATWLRSDGTVVPTSNAFARRVQAATNAADARTIARELTRTHVHAPARLLNAFAIFGHAAITRGGVTVARPRLIATPLPILGFIQGLRGRDAVDVAHIRVVSTRSGHRFWVLPAVADLCVATIDSPNGPPALDVFAGEPGVVGDCSGRLALALHGGVGVTGVTYGKDVYSLGVIPRQDPTTTVRSPGGGRRRTVRPLLGAFEVLTFRHR